MTRLGHRVYVSDPLKVAGPGWLLCGAVKDGVLEVLRGLSATGAGGWGVIAPRGVGVEVALARPHRMQAARGKYVETHKRMGLERGTVWVHGRIRGGILPFFDKETPAKEFELGVGAAWRGQGRFRRVSVVKLLVVDQGLQAPA